jgi:hypothetical protein
MAGQDAGVRMGQKRVLGGSSFEYIKRSCAPWIDFWGFGSEPQTLPVGTNEPASVSAKPPSMPPRQPRKPLRTFDASQHKPGRFRRESAEQAERTPVSATIAERVIARQVQGLDERRDDSG